MRNDMRPELSQKNPYWIGKHRYYELKHFCLQYPIWKKARLALDGLSRRPADLQVFVSCGQVKGDPTERCAQSRIFFGERMEMVEQAAIEAEPDLYPYLLRGVTEELSYDALKMKYDIVDVAVRQCYRFNCPNCGSRLEADCGDLVDIGGKTSRFWCPVCRKERYVPWSALRKRVVYEDKSAE